MNPSQDTPTGKVYLDEDMPKNHKHTCSNRCKRNLGAHFVLGSELENKPFPERSDFGKTLKASPMRKGKRGERFNGKHND